VTVYIIDSTRPLPPTTADNAPALVLQRNDTVILGDTGSIVASGSGSAGIQGDDNAFVLNGSVLSSQYVGIETTTGRISISSNGSVYGATAGIAFYNLNDVGSFSSVINSGKIASSGNAIFFDFAYGRSAVIENSGTIVGQNGIYFDGGSLDTDTLVITNTGLIKGETAIKGLWMGSTTIMNSGRIEGDIIVGGGGWMEPRGPSTNVYDGRGGTVTGEVFFGACNAIAYGGDGSEMFAMDRGTHIVDGGAGIDTLRTRGKLDLLISDKQQATKSSWFTIRNIENLVGSATHDQFFGTDGATILTGNGGHDTLDGRGGNDILSGGIGNDTLIGGEGSDIATYSGRYSDYTITTQADGSVTIVDNRALADGVDTLTGVEFALFSDRIFSLPASASSGPSPGPVIPPAPPAPAVEPAVPVASPTLVATTPVALPPSPLNLMGSRKADILVAGDGNDQLNGGLGNDKLTGGAGRDVFAFTTKLGRTNVDRVLDFHAEDDTIFLSAKVFGAIAKGGLSKDAFHIGSKAHDLDDRIIYNAKTGALSYDKDGSGSEYAAVKFAQLTPKTLVTADDFLVF
jgi:serralysin